jgi:hypothetical protein
LALLWLVPGIAPIAQAANNIVVSDVRVDTPTICCLGFSVPVTGDDNFDAAGTIEYRVAGTATWREGLPLLRVHPEFTSEESPPGSYGLPVPERQFAGSLFGLQPETNYDVRISITDPDGGDRTQMINVTTRGLPVDDPAVPRIVPVATDAELGDAISTAQPGDVIQVASGTYTGPLVISANGTLADPIILRGESVDTVTIDSTGAANGITISGDHVYLEQLTVVGSTWGARVNDTEGVVVRHSRFTNVNRGINATSGITRSLYICDNVLEGLHVWPNVSSSTWNDEGIAVGGEGHTVCHNTISGFGDALGLTNATSIPNIAIDFWGNDVRWTADDALELDFAHRNVRAFHNRATNVSMGASFQPVWGGPVCVFRNVFLNIRASAYKLNNDPSGFFIYHNTSARTLGTGNWGAHAWTSPGYTQADGDPAYAANFEMKNNLLIGLSDPAFVTTDLILDVIDYNGWNYNGWTPNGAFRFVNNWGNFADLQSSSPYEANGRILDDTTFATPLALPADYTTFCSGIDVTLGASSLAIDTALPLPGINDGYSGVTPDLGAIELGDAVPDYDVRASTRCRRLPRPTCASSRF